MDAAPFVFPAHIPRDVAEQMLAEAYQSIDEGKLLRATNKRLRKRGIDPPMDVQYVAEPAVDYVSDGLGIRLGADIMVYDAFPEMDACVDAFEEVLNELLVARLDKVVKRWLKKHPPQERDTA